MNPSRRIALFIPVAFALALGASVAGLIAWSDFPVYLIGSLLGAAAAVSLFRVINSEPA